MTKILILTPSELKQSAQPTVDNSLLSDIDSDSSSRSAVNKQFNVANLSIRYRLDGDVYELLDKQRTIQLIWRHGDNITIGGKQFIVALPKTILQLLQYKQQIKTVANKLTPMIFGHG